MAKPNVYIRFDTGTNIFKSGETIAGKCCIECKQRDITEGIELLLIGEANVQWKDYAYDIIRDNKVLPNKSHTSSEKYLEHIIYNSEGGFTLQSGRNELPFAVRLPCGIPCSFHGYYGSVTYQIRTVIYRSTVELTQQIDTEIEVQSPYDLSSIPNALNPVSIKSVDKMCVCCCCVKSSVSCSLTINHMVYAPGDGIIFEARITNKSKNDTQTVEVFLNQCSIFMADGQQVKAFNRVAELTKQGVIKAGSEDIWEGQNLLVPVTLTPTNLGGFKFCDIIKVEYTVQLDIKMQGDSLGSDVRMPVIISSMKT